MFIRDSIRRVLVKIHHRGNFVMLVMRISHVICLAHAFMEFSIVHKLNIFLPYSFRLSLASVLSLLAVPPRGRSCKDLHQQCHRWAEEGFCDIYSNYMYKKCRLSCQACYPGTHSLSSPAISLSRQNCSYGVSPFSNKVAQHD